MSHRCTECDWVTDEDTQTDPSTAAIHHYVETGHAVEKGASVTESPTSHPDDQSERLVK